MWGATFSSLVITIPSVADMIFDMLQKRGLRTLFGMGQCGAAFRFDLNPTAFRLTAPEMATYIVGMICLATMSFSVGIDHQKYSSATLFASFHNTYSILTIAPIMAFLSRNSPRIWTRARALSITLLICFGSLLDAASCIFAANSAPYNSLVQASGYIFILTTCGYFLMYIFALIRVIGIPLREIESSQEAPKEATGGATHCAKEIKTNNERDRDRVHNNVAVIHMTVILLLLVIDSVWYSRNIARPARVLLVCVAVALSVIVFVCDFRVRELQVAFALVSTHTHIRKSTFSNCLYKNISWHRHQHSHFFRIPTSSHLASNRHLS